ncbi:MAG: potassium transporter, partial [Gammaproteobacteria bacterium]|nr:potassium transporter [Gammaproteobacteria bacterium]
MQFFVIQRILGILLMIFSFTMLPPMVVSIIYLDGAFEPFFNAFAVTLITGIIAWLPVKNYKNELRLRDGFLIVVLFWTVLASFGAIPFVISTQIDISITDAIFESLSGLTTTGATVIEGLDKLPESILYYRQQLQWLGGMGIIVLAVAIMPLLGIGGMQLYKAETPGPMKDNKLTPRITETAKALWY